jgi:thiosulfate dehydrogenase [quinone] large subunit
MFVSFFESAKYVGHLYPIALLRIYMGYYYLNMALMRLGGEFLTQPRLAHIITENLPQKDLPSWYANVLQNIVVPNWRFFAYFITYCEFIIGVAFLIGFLVRPAALIGIFLMINFVYAGGGATGPLSIDLQQTFLALFIVMFWVGAGRCFGLDFYFYKRQRGLWW